MLCSFPGYSSQETSTTLTINTCVKDLSDSLNEIGERYSPPLPRAAGKKSTLTVKIQGWLFHMMYMNASPLGLPKKIRKISFGFWLVSVCLQKIGYSHFFAGGAWKRRRTTYADFEYEIWKVFDAPIHGKSLRCLRW